MQRVISLFAAAEQEWRLSRPVSGPPPGPARPDYEREPEYFQHLLEYLRQQRPSDAVVAPDAGNAASDRPEEALV